MMNILKSNELIEANEYQKLYYHFGFGSIVASLFSGITSYRFFDISFPDKNHISFKPKNDYFQLQNVFNLSKLLDKECYADLVKMTQEKTFNIKHKKKILCYLHLDWILTLQALKDGNENKNELVEYLQFETGNHKIEKKIFHINGTSENRSNIFTLNKDSVIIDLLNPSNSKNTTKLTNQNYNLILNNPIISFIEIAKGFDNGKLLEFLELMNHACQQILKLQIISNEMKFSLKIRKIKRTNKKGMYIANQNTIILDPRYVDSFIHELGHWYHTWFENKINEVKDAEIYAENFENILNF